MSKRRRSSRPSKLRPLDIVLIVIVAACTTAVAVYAYSGGEARYVSILSDGEEWIYSLDSEATVRIEGPVGYTTIEISGGMARIVDSPCADKVCVAAGPLERQGEWAACLPNGVLVRITGERSDVDAVAY